jgi:ribonuclease HI
MRNNALFGDGKCGIEQSSFFLQSYLTSFQDTREVEILTNPKGKHSVINLVPGMNLRRKEPEASWSRPDVGKAKLNFDASFLIENHSGSWGAVLRNDAGHVLMSAWGPINQCSSAEVAEAVAGLHAVKIILTTYAGPLHIENDCAALISELNGIGGSRSAIRDTTKDIRNILSALPDVTISKINRSANKVAHELAKLGSSGVCVSFMIGSAPPCVEDLVNQECNESVFS